MPTLLLRELLQISILGILQYSQLLEETLELHTELFGFQGLQVVHPGGTLVRFADCHLTFHAIIADRVKCLPAPLEFCPLCIF